MTDIYAYCPICNKEDGKEIKSVRMTVVNGAVTFSLWCGVQIVYDLTTKS